MRRTTTVRPPTITPRASGTVRPPTLTPRARGTRGTVRLPTLTPRTTVPDEDTVIPPTIVEPTREYIIGIMDLPRELQYIIIDNMDYNSLKLFRSLSDDPDVLYHIEETIRKRLEIYIDIIHHYLRYQDSKSWKIIVDELFKDIDIDKIKFLIDNFQNKGYVTIRGRPKILITNRSLKKYILPNADYDTLKYMQDNEIDVIKLATTIDMVENLAEKGNVDIFRFLIDMGHRYNVVNSSVLHVAVDNGNIDLVKFLVDQGADIVNDDSIIVYAVLSGNMELINWVADNGTVINISQAVREAIKMGRDDILRWFHDKGVNILDPSIIDNLSYLDLRNAGVDSKDDLKRRLQRLTDA